MSEFKTSQMPSEDADPINIEDERFGSVEILGTEGVADDQGGRKPGGVVNGSVCKVKKAETGLMYMSDSRPRSKCQGPMSSPRVERSKGMLHVAIECWSSRESPGSRVMFETLFLLSSSIKSVSDVTYKNN